MNYDKLLNNIFGNIVKSFETTNFYWQSLGVIICLVLAIIFYKIFKTAFLVKKQINPNSANIFHRYLTPLLLPTLIIIFLSIGAVIFANFFKNSFLFQTTIQLATLFVFLRFLRIVFNSNFIANLVGFFLIPTIILNILDLYDPTIAFLDSFAISIGKIRVSIYTIIQAFVVLSASFWGFGTISRKTKSYFTKKKNLEITTKIIISKLIDMTVYVMVFFITLRVFDVDMTTFAVIGGAIGVGIGFGLQKIASNFISGIILLFEKSVKVGDLVEIEGSNIYGNVTQFCGRYTLIETFDGREIMVPNEDFITNRVTSWTHNNSRGRVEINVGISYNSNLIKAQEIVLQSALGHSRCLNYPAPECYVTNFGDSSINLLAYFWVGDVMQGCLGIKSDVMIKIFEEFRENNISIPFPQREIFIINKR
jgi:small-conductance mechanosensitive channel